MILMDDMRASCGAVVIRGKGGACRILLVQYYDGHWSFPKGHMEQGETEEQTALREIREETGLSVELLPGFRAETVSVKRSAGARTVFFLGEPVSGSERVQRSELAAQKWVSAERAVSMVTFSEDRQVLQKALRFLEKSRPQKRHLLICGDVGVGKSTLIARLLKSSTRPLYGFATKRLSKAGEDGFCPVYLHPAAQNLSERTYKPENLVGKCGQRCIKSFPQVFDTRGIELLRAPEGSLILMDELGFLENDAAEFRAAVLRTLDGGTPVLAAVKSRDTEFLRAVKAHPNADLVEITRYNRDERYIQLLPEILKWNAQG